MYSSTTMRKIAENQPMPGSAATARELNEAIDRPSMSTPTVMTR